MRSGTPAWIHALAAVTAAATLLAAVDGVAAPRHGPTHGLRHEPTVMPASPTTVDIELDPFTSTASEVARWRESGRRVWCLLNVTAWEPDRPDADRFDASLLGSPIGDGTRNLELGRWDLLAPIVDDRLALCNAKGFVGVVIDDSTQFTVTAGERGAFVDRVRALATQRGLDLRQR